MEQTAVTPSDQFLRVDQAARIYPIGRNRLRALILAGEIPFIKIAGRYLVRPERIEEWLCKQESVAAPAGQE